MIGRLAAILLMGAMLALIWVTLNPTGYTAIVFSFVGHPLLVFGTILGFISMWRRKRLSQPH